MHNYRWCWTPLAILFVTCLRGGEGTPPAREWQYTVRAVEWTERLDDGSLYVEEKGVRFDAALELPIFHVNSFNLDYNGSAYVSLVRHQGWDRGRVAVPSGYESLVTVGQLGTAHFLQGSYLIKSAFGKFGPAAAVGLDTWYRPLKYYEIWIVPVLRYGVELRSAESDRWRFFAGASTLVGATQLTQTRNAPWNADHNIAQSLEGRTSPMVTFSWTPGKHSTIELGYLEYRFARNDPTFLRPGFGVYQPASRFRSVSISLRKDF